MCVFWLCVKTIFSESVIFFSFHSFFSLSLSHLSVQTMWNSHTHATKYNDGIIFFHVFSPWKRDKKKQQTNWKPFQSESCKLRTSMVWRFFFLFAFGVESKKKTHTQRQQPLQQQKCVYVIPFNVYYFIFLFRFVSFLCLLFYSAVVYFVPNFLLLCEL